jgi:hypothetical protein
MGGEGVVSGSVVINIYSYQKLLKGFNVGSKVNKTNVNLRSMEDQSDRIGSD